MKLEGGAGEAGTLLKALEGPAEGFPLNSEYTGFQKGGDVLLFKQQNRISCKSPTCNAGERYTGIKLNLRDRVLGKVVKDSFIALPGKGGHVGLMP